MTGLLGPAEVRTLAATLGVRPTKTLGQNFVHDANTVRRIARLAEVGPGDTVLEVGPGLGSLTLALLETGASVVAVEIDPVLAGALPGTVQGQLPDDATRLLVIGRDAMRLAAADLADWSGPPVSLVANLPYNVAVPVLLTLLAELPSLERGLVMVQAEVAERLAARAGEPAYGVPSAKAAWYADLRRAGSVPRQVFWPVPKVESGLVSFHRHASPQAEVSREQVFSCIDAAFAQRRKTLRAALAGWAGSPDAAEQALRAAGVDPKARGETLDIGQFAAVAAARRSVAAG